MAHRADAGPPSQASPTPRLQGCRLQNERFRRTAKRTRNPQEALGVWSSPPGASPGSSSRKPARMAAAALRTSSFSSSSAPSRWPMARESFLRPSADAAMTRTEGSGSLRVVARGSTMAASGVSARASSSSPNASAAFARTALESTHSGREELEHATILPQRSPPNRPGSRRAPPRRSRPPFAPACPRR
jgi:hypothetical protein